MTATTVMLRDVSSGEMKTLFRLADGKNVPTNPHEVVLPRDGCHGNLKRSALSVDWEAFATSPAAGGQLTGLTKVLKMTPEMEQMSMMEKPLARISKGRISRGYAKVRPVNCVAWKSEGPLCEIKLQQYSRQWRRRRSRCKGRQGQRNPRSHYPAPRTQPNRQ